MLSDRFGQTNHVFSQRNPKSIYYANILSIQATVYCCISGCTNSKNPAGVIRRDFYDAPCGASFWVYFVFNSSFVNSM